MNLIQSKDYFLCLVRINRWRVISEVRMVAKKGGRHRDR